MDRTTELLVLLHHGLDQLAPGLPESTLRAWSLCAPLPADPRVLDLGCGTGAQALVLAGRCGADVTAVDLAPALLATVRARAEAAGLADRVRTVEADLRALPFPDGAFDVIWSEGAIYLAGFDAGLKGWRRLLRPGGFIVVTELSWLVADPPAEAVDFWAAGYPAMRTVDGNVAAAERLGFRVVDVFTLPDAGWWAYYGPLRERLAPFLVQHPDDPDAVAVVEETSREIGCYERHGAAYGYVFYVLQG
jgi:SAM-dependent methyltransferase